VLQRLRAVLSELGNVAIPPPKQKTFDLEGEILERARLPNVYWRLPRESITPDVVQDLLRSWTEMDQEFEEW
jgi:hypothetical protein